MNWQELSKKRVIDLRLMMNEHLPEVKGVTGKKKEELIELLAAKLDIKPPTKIVAGVDKTVTKRTIRELKELRDDALQAGDHYELRKYRRKIHRLKRKMRRSQTLS